MGSLLYLPIALAIATCWLLVLTTIMTPISDISQQLKDSLHFPTSLQELKEIANLLSQFQVHHPGYVMLLFASAYLYKQTFAIPGSVFLNLLAGALYGPWIGTSICSVLTCLGATMCYLLSKMTGVDFVLSFWEEKINKLRQQIEENKDKLPYFMISIRLVPVSPNWFINITSPLLGIPITIFMPTALVGLLPYNFVCVQAGNMLAELKSVNDILNWGTIISFALMGIVISLPGFLAKKMHKE